MARFPVLDIEELVQEGDKTRLDASKSFISGDTPITQIEVKPGKLEAAIDTTQTRWLDWVYAFEVDVDAANNKLNFSEGGPELTATITGGAYTLAALASEIKTQMDAVGGQTYTVSVNLDGVFSFSAPGGFELLAATGSDAAASIYRHIGLLEDKTGAAAYFSSAVETVEKEITVTVSNLSGSDSIIKLLSIVSESADKLFSSDARLRQHEPEVLRYVQAGRASFKDVHRRSQGMILAWLDKEGFTDIFGKKLNKAALVKIEEFYEWGTFLALRLIFEGLSNAVDDVFQKKAARYLELEASSRSRAILRLDIDGDGVASDYEESDIRSAVVVRR